MEEQVGRASERWRAGVEARLDEIARLKGAIDRDYWDRTADRFARRVADRLSMP
jgi:hypothetical protein